MSVEGISRLSLLFNSIVRPTYRPRRLRSKGAILSLLWNFCVLLTGMTYFRSTKLDKIELSYQIILGCSMFAFPVAGFLADTCFGRYRVIKYSMIFAWLAAIAYVAILVLQQVVPKTSYLVLPALRFGLLSFAAYQANALQFGVDQLIDASSDDISSYVSWYAWAYFVSNCIGMYSQYSVCQAYIAVSSFIAPALLTLCLCLDIFFSDSWLIKEPVTYNPLSLIFRVLCYAKKNKYPRQRSAFTYWDDKRFSRIDLAKNKYGGPFTTEQVEDVKTFFRILLILFLGSLFIGLIFGIGSAANRRMISHYQDLNYVQNCSRSSAFLQNSVERSFVRTAASVSMVVFIPIFELLIYPLLWKCMPKLGIMKKFILGMFFQLLYVISLTALEVIGHRITSKHFFPGGHNVTCLLKNIEVNHNGLVLDFRWITLTKLLDGISLYFLLTSGVEFLCAQSPYSMKGLLGGLIYTLGSLSILLSTLATLPFKHLFENEEFGSMKFGCGVWYFMTMSVLALVFIVLAIIVTKCYSRRRRDEDIHNEQMFAVDYYDRYIS